VGGGKPAGRHGIGTGGAVDVSHGGGLVSRRLAKSAP
jgi:hypothetical protein